MSDKWKPEAQETRAIFGILAEATTRYEDINEWVTTQVKVVKKMIIPKLLGKKMLNRTDEVPDDIVWVTIGTNLDNNTEMMRKLLPIVYKHLDKLYGKDTAHVVVDADVDESEEPLDDDSDNDPLTDDFDVDVGNL